MVVIIQPSIHLSMESPVLFFITQQPRTLQQIVKRVVTKFVLQIILNVIDQDTRLYDNSMSIIGSAILLGLRCGLTQGRPDHLLHNTLNEKH